MSNKKTFSPKKSAFSLIELSIVLIIIGLLIAGITGGASLISNSTLRAVMGEARGYAVAVNSFYAQYNALPGDYKGSALPTNNIISNGSNTWTVGNGNNTIEYSNGEGIGAMYHLVGTKIVDPTSLFPNSNNVGQMTLANGTNVSAAFTVGTHFPASKSKGAGWIFDNVPTAAYAGSVTENVVVLVSSVASGTNLTANATTNVATAAPSLVPADALSIDTKVDDGIPTTGRVTGTAVAGCFTGTITSSTGTAYATGTPTKACVLAYQVDPTI